MDGGRKKWLAESARSEHRPAGAHSEDLQGQRARYLAARVPPEVQQASRRRARRSSTCAARRSSPARSSRRRDCRRPASAAATFPARRASRGRSPATTTGRSRAVEDLKALYGDAGIAGDQPVIAYCRIGERSSHTWFVLKYLLGFNNVKNYDGSGPSGGTWSARRSKEAVTRNAEAAELAEQATKVLAERSAFPVISKKPEEYSRRQMELAGWPIDIETYKLGDVYHCTIANVDPGARFARADGSTKAGSRGARARESDPLSRADAAFPTSKHAFVTVSVLERSESVALRSSRSNVCAGGNAGRWRRAPPGRLTETCRGRVRSRPRTTDRARRRGR